MNAWKLIEENIKTVEYVVKALVRSGKIGADEYDDYLQTGCLELYKRVSKYDGSVKFSTYAEKVLTNAFIDIYRKKKVSSINTVSVDAAVENHDGTTINLLDLLEAEKNTENEVLDRILFEQVSEHIRKVKGKTKAATTVKGFEALELKIQGYSAKEIASMYNVPANSMRMWMSRARKILMEDSSFMKLIPLEYEKCHLLK